MELPHLGDQCSEKSCRQLDFLPVKCDGCKQSFCNQHWTYEGHSCPKASVKDVQVPVCPLCDKPVPSKPGAVPDEAVSRHLDRDCRADQKKNPRCSKAKCKVRELIKVDCDQCRLNFCLKHRHPQDHQCTGKPQSSMNAAGRAAMARQNPTTRQVPTVASTSCRPSVINGNMSEDEALARALSASLAENATTASASSNRLSQEEQDRMLALALAQSEGQQPSQSTSSSGANKSCQIS